MATAVRRPPADKADPQTPRTTAMLGENGRLGIGGAGGQRGTYALGGGGGYVRFSRNVYCGALGRRIKKLRHRCEQLTDGATRLAATLLHVLQNGTTMARSTKGLLTCFTCPAGG